MKDKSSEEKQAELLALEGFPTRLKQAIGKKSIRAFARECGLSDTVLRQYLSGQSEPTRPVLLTIARVADVGLEWLVAGKPSPGEVAEGLLERYLYREALAFEKDWLKTQFPIAPDDLLLASVKDDSMEPTLYPGDVILVDTTYREPEAIVHGIYVLQLESRILVKRLQYLMGNTLRVLSDNPIYESFSIDLSGDASGLSIMGKVIWFGRTLSYASSS